MSVTVTKGPPDPICTRVSIGGDLEVGFYCVYRGELGASIKAVRESLKALEAMKHAKVEPPIDRDIKQIGSREPGSS